MLFSKYPRHIKNVMIFPSVQLKYAALNAAVLCCTLIISMFIESKGYQHLKDQMNQPASQQAIDEVTRIVTQGNITLLISSVLIIFVMNILIVHRFLGPVFAFKRYFESLKNKDPNAKLILREHDALKPLADYFKNLNLQVDEKKNETT